MKKEKNIQDDNVNDIDKNEKKIIDKEIEQKLLQERKQKLKIKITNPVFENVLIAVAIMIYFILINFMYYSLENNETLLGLKILTMIVLSLSIIVLEIGYKKDDGKIAIHAIELLGLASYTLSVAHIVEKNKLNFAVYILISSFIFAIYYILKAVIIFIKDRRQCKKSISDVREIVKNKPIKKEAKKKENKGGV